MKFSWFVIPIILFASSAGSLDFESYCKGACSARYVDGIYRHGKCACIDYYPINVSGRIKTGKLSGGRLEVWDGVDEMHVSPSE